MNSSTTPLDITTIILTYNEEKHIDRCIKSLSKLVRRIVVIDSYSTDRTCEICKQYGADFFQNKWVNYSKQFQWGLDNSNISTKWTMRMDADEYLEDDLIEELHQNLNKLEFNINGIYLKRKVFFNGKWIKHGGFYPHTLLRIWKTGEGRIEQRWMDEHIVLKNPNIVVMKHDIVDDNLNNIGWWIDKHNKYATREAIDLLNIKYQFVEEDNALLASNDPQAKYKRIIKEHIYSKVPISFRAFLYFTYRYLIRLGFLDGHIGFTFHFLQGFWYRYLVDLKFKEINKQVMIKKAIKKSEIIDIIKLETGLDIN